MELQPVTPITCKNCGNKFIGKYCNECGEKVYTEHDRHFIHFFEDGFHFVTHFDGKFFTTIKTLFTKPGQVSVDYAGGIRKKYFKLLSLFMLLVVLYLLFPLFEGMNMKIYYHAHHDIYGKYAMKKTLEVMKEKNLNEHQMAELFDKTSEKTSKFLLVLLIPFTALITWAVSFRRRKYFFDQLIFSTEVNCVFLLWGFLLFPLLFKIFELVYHHFAGNYLPMSDPFAALIMAIPFIIYVAIASHRFYSYNKTRSVFFTLFFLIVHTLIVQVVYKFILFVVVINQIH